VGVASVAEAEAAGAAEQIVVVAEVDILGHRSLDRRSVLCI
jgi:hypothetical protein